MSNQQQSNDRVLWQLIQAGDRKAFDQLYLAHVKLLYRYGMKLSPRRELVQDSIQDLFIDLWRKREQLSIQQSLKSYLLISFRRRLLRQLKQAQELRTVEWSATEETDHFVLGENPSAFPPQKIKAIKAAIPQLSRRQREAIHLKYVENMDYEEIAQIMELQVRGVYKLISTGVKRLREIVSEKPAK